VTRAEALLVRDYERGAKLVGDFQVTYRFNPWEGGSLFVEHGHLEPGSLAPITIEVGLVPIASGRAWIGVCTCGQRFVYKPGPYGPQPDR